MIRNASVKMAARQKELNHIDGEHEELLNEIKENQMRIHDIKKTEFVKQFVQFISENWFSDKELLDQYNKAQVELYNLVDMEVNIKDPNIRKKQIELLERVNRIVLLRRYLHIFLCAGSNNCKFCKKTNLKDWDTMADREIEIIDERSDEEDDSDDEGRAQKHKNEEKDDELKVPNGIKIVSPRG